MEYQTFKISGSEQYYMMIDPNVKVLAVSEFKLNNWPNDENEISEVSCQ